MLWNPLSFGHSIAEEMAFHSQDKSTVTNWDCHQDGQSSTDDNHQNHLHLCNSAHTLMTVESGYELPPLTLISTEQTCFTDPGSDIKDVFLDGPFQPPRPSLS